MSARFFLDTNIFVYSFDRSAPAKNRRAAQLVRDAVNTNRGVVSYQVVQEFFNAALKRFPVPMTLAEAEQYLRGVFRSLLAVHSSLALFAEALTIQTANKLSWYDSLIVAAAIQAKCEILYTEDLQHGQQYGSLKVVNPFL
jgi:predicted nucleic acid-binding protein